MLGAGGRLPLIGRCPPPRPMNLDPGWSLTCPPPRVTAGLQDLEPGVGGPGRRSGAGAQLGVPGALDEGLGVAQGTADAPPRSASRAGQKRCPRLRPLPSGDPGRAQTPPLHPDFSSVKWAQPRLPLREPRGLRAAAPAGTGGPEPGGRPRGLGRGCGGARARAHLHLLAVCSAPPGRAPEPSLLPPRDACTGGSWEWRSRDSNPGPLAGMRLTMTRGRGDHGGGGVSGGGVQQGSPGAPGVGAAPPPRSCQARDAPEPTEPVWAGEGRHPYC